MNGPIPLAGGGNEHASTQSYNKGRGPCAGQEGPLDVQEGSKRFERSVGPFHMPAELADGLGLESDP